MLLLFKVLKFFIEVGIFFYSISFLYLIFQLRVLNCLTGRKLQRVHIAFCLPVFGFWLVLVFFPLEQNDTELRCLRRTDMNLWHRSWSEISPGAWLTDTHPFVPHSYEPSSKLATIFLRDRKVFSLKQV